MLRKTYPKVTCPSCRRAIALDHRGVVRAHVPKAGSHHICPGSRLLAVAFPNAAATAEA